MNDRFDDVDLKSPGPLEPPPPYPGATSFTNATTTTTNVSHQPCTTNGVQSQNNGTVPPPIGFGGSPNYPPGSGAYPGSGSYGVNPQPVFGYPSSPPPPQQEQNQRTFFYRINAPPCQPNQCEIDRLHRRRRAIGAAMGIAIMMAITIAVWVILT